MDSLRKTIEVPVARREAANAWVRFIDSVLVGSRRLACDELACVDPLGSGLVGFDDAGDGRTRVSVTLPVADDAGDDGRELLDHKISHDLVLFWDYVDSGEYRREHAPDSVNSAAVHEEMRSGRLTPQDRRPDPDAFSVRRSFRT